MLESDAEEEKSRQWKEANERAERLHAGDWLSGWLLVAREAPHHHVYGESGSYYIRLKTSQGIQELWGKDLGRAIEQSRSKVKVGDAVGVRITRKEPFVATLPDGTKEDRIFNHYQVERATYVVQQLKVARKILQEPISKKRAGTEDKAVTAGKLILTAADLLADAYRLPPDYRERFVEGIRAAAGIGGRLPEAPPQANQTPLRPQEEAALRAKEFRAGAWLRGRLIEAEKAPYKHSPSNSESFYLKLQTSYGIQTIWGKDLERAVTKSKSHVKQGNEIAVRITLSDKIAVDKDKMTIEKGARDEVRGFNHYEVETARFIERRAQVADKILANPVAARRQGLDGRVVTGSYLLLTAGEMLAKSKMLEVVDQDSFIEGIRSAAAMPRLEQTVPKSVDNSTRHHAVEIPVRHPTSHRAGFARE